MAIACSSLPPMLWMLVCSGVGVDLGIEVEVKVGVEVEVEEVEVAGTGLTVSFPFHLALLLLVVRVVCHMLKGWGVSFAVSVEVAMSLQTAFGMQMANMHALGALLGFLEVSIGLKEKMF
ncbi:hypothetical protein BDN71DRAFT_1426857 [Pleurotus eryngii]|uniref:Uncharacterized protein n=1 Tax=Pleurotus eryngii TaxID=5323 RepID=A0A9P6DJP1_PLEER|nr:hypothetical protein BDN71DRAFT_1426857 [Pleurotus eryngii]